MIGQLESTRTQLANERKASGDKTRRAEGAEQDLRDAKERLHKAVMEIDALKGISIQLKVPMERLVRL